MIEVRTVKNQIKHSETIEKPQKTTTFIGDFRGDLTTEFIFSFDLLSFQTLL